MDVKKGYLEPSEDPFNAVKAGPQALHLLSSLDLMPKAMNNRPKGMSYGDAQQSSFSHPLILSSRR